MQEASTTVTPQVEIRALGGFEVRVAGEPLRFAFKAPRKPLDLLKALLTAGGASISQRTLCDSLWRGLNAWSASRALNTAVFRLRKLLGAKHSIRVDAGQLRLEPTYCSVDAWEFEEAIDGARSPESLHSVLRRYHGPFLGDCDHPLVADPRRRLQRKFVRGLLELAQGYEEAGKIAAAVDLYNRGLDVESTAEELHSALISCLERSGQTAAAAAAYQRCLSVFRSRLPSTLSGSGWTAELAKLLRNGN